MKVRHTMTQQVLKTGMYQHFKNKGKVWTVVWFLIALFFIYFGISLMTNHTDKGLGLLSCLFALVFLFQRKIAIWISVRKSFKDSPQTQEVLITVSEHNLTIKSPRANGSAMWQQFSEVVVTNYGILLYTQKNNFNWIPKSKVEGGSWQEFTDFINEKVGVS